MSTTHSSPTEREEIEMLLPWYVMGTLDADEHAHVAAYLKAHPEMAAQVALINQERAETVATNEAIQAPPASAFDALSAQIANDARAPSVAKGLWSRVTEFFQTPTPRAVQWAGAAAAVVVLLQAVAITSLLPTDSPSTTYKTASGEKAGPAQIGTLAMVQFTPSATAAEIAATLQSMKLVIVDGPLPGGLYKMRIAPTRLPETERAQRIADMQSRQQIFSLVTPSGDGTQ